MSHPISDAMAGMTAEERAVYKAQQYAARPAPDNLTAGSRIVSIIEGPTYENGLVRVVLALWIDFGMGMELQDLGSMNPFYFRNPPILIDDAGGDIVREWTDGTGNHQRVFREDPDQALMQACMDALESFVGTGGEM